MQSAEDSLSGLHPYLHPLPERASEREVRTKNASTAQSSVILKGNPNKRYNKYE